MFQFQTLTKPTVALVVAPAIALACLCATQSLAHADDGTVIDITTSKRSAYALAVPMASSGDKETNGEIANIVRFNFKVAGWFKVLDPRSFLANLKKEALGIEPESWKSVGAFGVIKYRSVVTGKRVVVDFKFYEVEKGASASFSKSYRGDKKDVRSLTHQFCNELIKHLTGEEGFFGSKLAFVTKRKKKGKRIRVVDFDGNGGFTITRTKYNNILPSWSPDGGKLAFTSYMRNNPDLYVVKSSGGRPKRVSKHFGMNTGATWSPDGSKIALTLSKDGNPEIYIINAKTGKTIKRLTKNPYIDTSPAWSPNGKEIAFVSDREGSPQIFVMTSSGKNQRRISTNGSYNTTPAWSPMKGTRMLAYTTRDGGRFDIVTKDLNSGAMVRITQNEGTNEEPSFSPNGRAIAFSRKHGKKSGIYIAPADGKSDAVRVWKGKATSVTWGPTP